MGFDVTRFQGDVDEELICPICSGVLEEPLQVSSIKSLNMIFFKFRCLFQYLTLTTRNYFC